MGDASNPVYYFGCLRQCGHFLFDPSTRHFARRDPDGFPGAWRSRYGAGAALDGALLDKGWEQEKGAARLHHVDGWTALAFWDRSVDHRPGSKSVFVTHRVLPFAEMLEAARAAWPEVFARLAFEVREHAVTG